MCSAVQCSAIVACTHTWCGVRTKMGRALQCVIAMWCDALFFFFFMDIRFVFVFDLLDWCSYYNPSSWTRHDSASFKFVHFDDGIIIFRAYAHHVDSPNHSESTRQQQRNVVPPFKRTKHDIGRSNKQSRHYARIFVRQEMAMKDGLAGIILVLDPNVGPSVWWNSSTTVSLQTFVWIETHDFRQNGIGFRREFGTYFLYL